MKETCKWIQFDNNGWNQTKIKIKVEWFVRTDDGVVVYPQRVADEKNQKPKTKKNQQENSRRYYLLGIRFMARSGRRTRIVRMAVKFKFSMFKQYSSAPDNTIKKSKRFQESARYVFLP